MDDRIVAVEDGIDDEFAEAGDREDLFGEDGAGEQGAEFEGAEGDDRDEGVAQRVVEDDGPFAQAFGTGGADIVLFEGGETYTVASRPPLRDLAALAAGDGEIRSPMPGKVVSVGAGVGDQVNNGQVLLVLEAMKMEHALVAPFDGVVEALSVSTGDQVAEGIPLARLKGASS